MKFPLALSIGATKMDGRMVRVRHARNIKTTFQIDRFTITSLCLLRFTLI